MQVRSRRPIVAALLVGSLVVAGCTSGGSAGSRSTGGPFSGGPRSGATTAGAPSTAPARSGSGACPTTYLAPDPQRPRTSLRFVIAADHGSVGGHETVAFTPDRPVTELVFRLTANSPAPAGVVRTQTRVTRAVADHGGGAATYTSAGAAPDTQGGLLHIPFAAPVAAGTTVTATIDFSLTLGDVVPQAFPRYGRDSGYAYFGSGAPLLAWERGHGWHTEDLVGFPAESATSEASATDLTVVAPAADVVIASGNPTPSAPAGGTRTWHATLDAARDVSVAAGPFADTTTTVGPVTLHLGAYSAAQRNALVPEFRRAITELAERFGPFPFPSLSVARLPVAGGGIEYPSSILMLDSSQLVAVHETAHQWFYAMLGDSQSRDPWLDEAFAQYSEELVDGSAAHPADLRLPGAVDSSVQSYGDDGRRYYATTYYKGAAALEAARTAAGASAWDAALRCYVAANAWRIVVPADLEKALSRLPAAVAVLRKAGALP